MTGPVFTIGWIKLSRFCDLSGYTPKAVERKRQAGVWPQGDIWTIAPDGNVHINWERYQTWVNRQQRREA
jgi:hypothetical protein